MRTVYKLIDLRRYYTVFARRGALTCSCRLQLLHAHELLHAGQKVCRRSGCASTLGLRLRLLLHLLKQLRIKNHTGQTVSRSGSTLRKREPNTYSQVLGGQCADVPEVGVHLLESLLVLLLLGVGELHHQGRRTALQVSE